MDDEKRKELTEKEKQYFKELKKEQEAKEKKQQNFIYAIILLTIIVYAVWNGFFRDKGDDEPKKDTAPFTTEVGTQNGNLSYSPYVTSTTPKDESEMTEDELQEKQLEETVTKVLEDVHLMDEKGNLTDGLRQ